MLLILDNYDSFTYNIVQYVGELGVSPVVYRNDTLTADEAIALAPQAIIISPGPCTPSEAGISVPLVRAAAAAGIPLLGVCLGHQAIGEAFGATVVRADRLMHGKTTDVVHDGAGLFAELPSPLTVMRYHSLVIAPATVTARPARSAAGRPTVRPGRKSWPFGTAAARSTGSSSTRNRSARSMVARSSATSSGSLATRSAIAGWNVCPNLLAIQQDRLCQESCRGSGTTFD